MKALTLWRPWPWAFALGGKRIENRTWAPPASLLGERLYLHAGERYDEEGRAVILRLSGAVPPDDRDRTGHNAPGYVFASGVVRGAVLLAGDDGGGPGWRGKVGSGFDPQTVILDRWAFGPWAWVLDDLLLHESPTRIRGRQGIWNLPEGMNLGRTWAP